MIRLTVEASGACWPISLFPPGRRVPEEVPPPEVPPPDVPPPEVPPPEVPPPEVPPEVPPAPPCPPVTLFVTEPGNAAALAEPRMAYHANPTAPAARSNGPIGLRSVLDEDSMRVLLPEEAVAALGRGALLRAGERLRGVRAGRRDERRVFAMN